MTLNPWTILNTPKVLLTPLDDIVLVVWAVAGLVVVAAIVVASIAAWADRGRGR